MSIDDDRSILLVEDSEQDQELTLRALRKNKIFSEVVVVRDGSEALDFLFADEIHAGRDPRALPRLILLDLNLPKIDGLEVLRRLRANERTRLLPVVILTSSNEERDRLAAYTNGANSYVRKPIDFTEFSEAVRQLGVYWLTLNQPPPRTGQASAGGG
jgi:two-component system, response regulator